MGLGSWSGGAFALGLVACSMASALAQPTVGDLRPGDWSYEALAALSRRESCPGGAALLGETDTVRRSAGGAPASQGGRVVSRFEAAALLRSCLAQISDRSDVTERLLREFGPELALLKGQSDGLEARIGELEAMRFSPSTTLSGQLFTFVGANYFSGRAIARGSNTFRSRSNDPGSNEIILESLPNATTMNYELELDLNTSFTGKDNLFLKLRTGDFGDSVFGGNPQSLSLATLDVAFEKDCNIGDCGNVVVVDELYYSFPVGAGFTFTLAAKAYQSDLFAMNPSLYPAESILNVFTGNGAQLAYNNNIGSGGALWWSRGGFKVSAIYLAGHGAFGDPNAGGLGTAASAATGTLQVGYAADQWGVAAIYTRLQPDAQQVPAITPFANGAVQENLQSRSQGLGIGGYWQPAESLWWPSVSVGLGFNQTRYQAPQPAGSLRDSRSWQVGLQWSDVLWPGNALGVAVAQPVMATSLTDGQKPHDGGFVWEGWYRFQISDSISITPALIYLSRPLGQSTPPGESLHQLGALIKTSLQF